MATAGATKVKGLDASYYTVKDLARATKFYNELLGMEPTFTFGENVVEYTFPDGETFGLYRTDEWTPHGGLLFSVDDIQKAIAENKARGVKFDGDGHVEETPVCHMAFGEDSEGNSFILHQRK
ncbi:MAG: VOC family protein [Candidatus Eremiobacteraeota bacterium]|nr:VOC family protein [Candidatus Eremiobacteraeota bacterium]MBV8365474.1 VOC family protein [Candidatus Eremiobacteraeota bacterium]